MSAFLYLELRQSKPDPNQTYFNSNSALFTLIAMLLVADYHLAGLHVFKLKNLLLLAAAYPLALHQLQ